MNLPEEDCSGKDKGKNGLLKKSMYGTRVAASNGNETGKGISKIGVTIFGAVQETFFSQSSKENLGLDTWRRLDGDRNEGEFGGTQEAAGRCVSNQSTHHRRRFGKEYQGAESGRQG